MKITALLLCLGIWEDMPKAAYKYDASLSKTTNVHEATHFVNASMIKKNTYGIWCLNQTFIFDNPPFKKIEVIPYVPVELRFDKYDNYFLNKHYNDYPLYLLDELSAYINGASCSLESSNNTNNETDIAAILEMSIYATCLMRAIKDKNPQLYQDNYDQFVQLLKLGHDVFIYGLPHYPHESIKIIMEELTNHPHYAIMEEMLGTGCFSVDK